MDQIKKYVGALDEVFKTAPDKHEANYRSRAVLEDMSGNRAFFSEALEKHLRTPGALNTKHYPVVGLNIELNAYYGLVANCWIPLPDRKSDISTKAIHHHGDMLLSTVTSFGPGYEHWTFSRPVETDAGSELYAMQLIERAPHPRHHVAFVDSYIAHLPFYPPDTSVTYALWSSKFSVTWKDKIKRVPVLQKNSAALRGLAVRAGLARSLDLKVVEYFDFYPTSEGFRGIRERTEFERGPNEDYLYSLFHVIQVTENDHLAPIISELLESSEALENPQLVRQLLKDLQQGKIIEGRLSSTHYGVERANFTRSEAERALDAQGRTAQAPLSIDPEASAQSESYSTEKGQ